MAAQLIGHGTDQTGAGMTSALGHAIGASFKVGNGLAKAVLLPHTLAFNAPETEGRLQELADALDSRIATDALAITHACRTFFASLEVPTRLRDLGVPLDALPLIAGDAVQDWFLGQNPRKADEAELAAILKAAW